VQLTAIVLILISAVTHAGWNFIGKRNQPTSAFFLLANTIGALLLTPVIVLHLDKVRLMPVQVWALLGLTSIFMGVYYASLAAAYRHGHISIAYPLARSSPVIVVTVAALVLGQGKDISTQCIAGILLVVGGCFMLPVPSFRDWHLRDYRKWSCLFALFAAVGTAGYSMIDDRALRIMRTAPDLGLGAARAALLYISLEAWGATAALAAILLLTRYGRSSMAAALRDDKAQASLTGLGIYLTYTLVLTSLGFVRNVSYVVAFRQLSIPLGAALGIWLLREPLHRPKVVGICTILAGLVMVGTG